MPRHMIVVWNKHFCKGDIMAVNLTKEKPAEKKESISDANVLNLLYTQVAKPKNIIKEAVFNVYSDEFYDMYMRLTNEVS